ncbi:MAG: ACT domain-containing protein [Chthoniobacterales bacterium]
MSDPNFSIKAATQLAIFMTNRPGSLAAACRALAEAGVNIEALATEGDVFGSQGGEILVRMVVSDPSKAVTVLAEEGAVAVKADVLLIEGGNEPGMLAGIADRLATAEVNIESIYLSASADARRCMVILRPSDVEKAHRLLRDL